MNTREKYPNSTKLTWLYFPFSPFLSGRFTKLWTEAYKQNYWYTDKFKKIPHEISSQLINIFVYSQAKLHKTIWTSNHQASFPTINPAINIVTFVIMFLILLQYDRDNLLRGGDCLCHIEDAFFTKSNRH